MFEVCLHTVPIRNFPALVLSRKEWESGCENIIALNVFCFFLNVNVPSANMLYDPVFQKIVLCPKHLPTFADSAQSKNKY